jgi:DNA-binding beta-propeller fold protein YncE
MTRISVIAASVVLATTALWAAENASKQPLHLARAAELADVSGDMDHLAIDAAGQRLFVAAEDNGTLRVIDLKTGKLQRTVKGFQTPHSILYVPGADSIGVDRRNHTLYTVSGGKDVSMTKSAISEIDFASGKLVREIPIDAVHVEAMALETSGDRLFVNVTDKNYLAVLNRRTGEVVARWTIKEAEQNAPIAFDEKNHRLFVVCRKPGKLVVLDSRNGKTVTSFNTGLRADEVVFDPVHHRIYVAAGEGSIYVYQQIDADHYRDAVKIASETGAKTALLSPDANQLFVAVSPGEGKTGAKILMYDVN